KALIDSGAHMTLVAKGLVKKENLEKTKRQQPIKMRNADGTPNRNGKLTEDARIQMDLGGHKEEIKALVSDISSADIFLGYDWLMDKSRSQIL
ncbi:hypothetical protein AGABI2DRAFT_61880, partial [Agaricus bisporus var. bisporus H97]|uniref:hypothetical protein n=1 Tax=Agaricus bisporus var. bisporus (strain H97 / ATCC MYA-4626 / FGSC 10389) TaxID=936046 RepID=UPI00029F65DC